MKKSMLFLLLISLTFACNNNEKKEKTVEENEVEKSTTQAKKQKEPEIIPVSHASFIMKWDNKTIFNDPVGGTELYEKYGNPDLVLVSDIHGDHFNLETLEALKGDFAIIAPQAVIDKMPKSLQNKTRLLENDKSMRFENFKIKAIPMYNITEERLKFHTKGRGNGYLIDNGEFRLYISGDTENIPEMMDLHDVDLAFMCMNLPYTMTVEQAVEGVLAFEPKTVIPYHYRGLKDGETHYYNTELFERLVSNADQTIQVKRMNFYPNR